MLKKAKAFIALIALIAFVTTARCEITIYTKDHEQLDLEFKDALSNFGGYLPDDGLKVF